MALLFSALRINLSEESREAINAFPGFDVEPRGETSIEVNRVVLLIEIVCPETLPFAA